MLYRLELRAAGDVAVLRLDAMGQVVVDDCSSKRLFDRIDAMIVRRMTLEQIRAVWAGTPPAPSARVTEAPAYRVLVPPGDQCGCACDACRGAHHLGCSSTTGCPDLCSEPRCGSTPCTRHALTGIRLYSPTRPIGGREAASAQAQRRIR